MAGHVQLRRNTRPLLRTVNGQPHARDDDHHEPSPPSEPLAKPADVDINAEPQSTSEDDFSSAETSKPALQAGKQRRGATRIKPPARNTWHFNTREQKLRSKNGEHGVSDTQSSGPSTSGARSNGSPSTQGMDELFGGLGDGPNKRRRTTLKYGSTLNIHSKHAPQTSTGRPAVQCKEASSGTMGTPAFKFPTDSGGAGLGAVDKTQAAAFRAPPDIRVGSKDSSQPKPASSFRQPPPSRTLRSVAASTCEFRKPPGSREEPPDEPYSDPLELNGSQIPERSNIRTGSSSPLSSPPESIVFSSQAASDTLDYRDSASCPVCNSPVDAAFLLEYRAGKRMNVRKQAQFCRAHKKRSAEEEWRRRQYPEIDWDNLDKRLAGHQPHLEAVLDQTVPSHFRDRLAERVRSGRERTLLQSLAAGGVEALTPGYYGTRGAKLMMELITKTLTPQLRRLAGSDKLIAGSGGVSGYVQAVLVPELATLLVMEDMDVGKERAIDILSESIEIGDLVNEEEEDQSIPRRKSPAENASPVVLVAD